MTHALLRPFAAFALLAAAAPALAQAPAPASADPPADSTIVVTGERAADLVVDVERIALRCIACRRALQRLRTAAARTAADGGPFRRPPEEELPGGPDGWGRGTDACGVAMDDHRKALRSGREAAVRATRALDRAEAADGAERYTANLLRLVEPIVERIRQERGAESVLAPRDPAARGRRLPDISDAVIEILDRDHAGADLLESEA